MYIPGQPSMGRSTHRLAGPRPDKWHRVWCPVSDHCNYPQHSLRTTSSYILCKVNIIQHHVLFQTQETGSRSPRLPQILRWLTSSLSNTLRTWDRWVAQAMSRLLTSSLMSWRILRILLLSTPDSTEQLWNRSRVSLIKKGYLCIDNKIGSTNSKHKLILLMSREIFKSYRRLIL